MREFQLIVLTPAGQVDPSVAIAATRAGGVGVLNLEYAAESSRARVALAKLAHYANGQCGVKLNSSTPDFGLAQIEALPKTVGTVILTAWGEAHLAALVAACRHGERRVWLEVCSVQQAALGAALGVDGLVAKGNECSGWVADETAFILLQRLLAETTLPVYAYGGIGLHTAAACYVAGAAGVVLETQLALTRESTLPEAVRTAVAAMDGSETVCLGTELGKPFRVFHRPDATVIEEMNGLATRLGLQGGDAAAAEWRRAVESRVGWNSVQQDLWPLDQAAAFAADLARRYKTVGGVLTALRAALEEHVRHAAQLRPLDAGAPLAAYHRTRYPIVQGPMTRVSDRAEFALAVAEGGGLPFLALALMRKDDVAKLLEETKTLLGTRSWGVGILGFVPRDLRQEQMEAILQAKPPFALIAGGRPDQAHALEREGITTYLHVPSPGLLRLFLRDGARHFIFEGRECGGHVGPRSSFVLWNTMVDVLLEELTPAEAAKCAVLFAGGVHDALSAAMVATLAAPLAERGVKLGVLMGTAYLFTAEAVQSGAIVAGFQEEAIQCEGTVLLESGPGHATRCIPTPFVDVFQAEKLRLQEQQRPSEEVRMALEELNIGRLRMASKGITRHPRFGQDAEAPKYVTVDETQQRHDGMYMIGQVASLRHSRSTIEELHHEVAVTGMARLAVQAAVTPADEAAAQPAQIAIVGISMLLPQAHNTQEFWDNVLNKVSAITEVPRERWDADLYFDPDRKTRDKVYSRVGGFLGDLPFDPVEFGIPPSSLASIEPMQLLALLAVRDVLADAGYAERPFDRSRTSVILGASGGVGDLGAKYLLRSGLPMLFGPAGYELAVQAGDVLPEWTEDTFAGVLLNVTAGRVANRFDFGGFNYIVDAACASSLAALHLSVQELVSGATDMVITGGVDTTQNPFGYLCFSKTQALSPSGQPRVFDAEGDGIVISEGAVMLALKRLADAERDGDRVYAVISAVSGSSDGRALGMTAPRPEGQVLALQRAYAQAGFSATTVGLFEAHGTGTAVGDRTEAQSLANFLQAEGAQPQSHAIGAVKSMIGHTKAAAGVVGVAKMAYALYHKVLPPTLGVTQPNPKAGFGDGPLYVNAETRPWIQGVQTHPRRAGVSAFGFGGTNFHAVMEEYTGDFLPGSRRAVMQQWPVELMLWPAQPRAALLAELQTLQQALTNGAQPRLVDLAFSLWRRAKAQAAQPGVRLALVAGDLADLQRKLAASIERLAGDQPAEMWDVAGVYLTESPLGMEGKVAFLYPGQGSQVVNMGRDLVVHFAEARTSYEIVDATLAAHYAKPLSAYVFPPPAFSAEEEQAQQRSLTATQVAQPALGAAGMAATRVLSAFGVTPELVAGHSYGEYVALWAAGVFDAATLAQISAARGFAIAESTQGSAGTMAAVWADAATTTAAVEGLNEVWVANVNAPTQTILSGSEAGIAAARERLNAAGIQSRAIPVAAAFHSPLMAPAQQRLASALAAMEVAPATVEVYSNSSAAPYPQESAEMRTLLAEHLLQPVRFVDEINAMYAAGARLFIEVGAGSVLTNLVGQVLGERAHMATPIELPRQHGLSQLQHALARLAVHGVSVQLDRLFEGREARVLNLSALVTETQPKPRSATTWLLNGGRVRPAHVPAAPQPIPFAGLSLSNHHHEPTPALPPVEQPLNSTYMNGKQQHVEPPATPIYNGTPVQSTTLQPAVSTPMPVFAAQSAPAPEVDQVMLQYQQSMARFLETQRTVMLAYLQGAPSAPVQPVVAQPVTMQPAPVPQVAVQPVVMQVPAMPAEAPPTASPAPVRVSEPVAAPARVAEPVAVAESQPGLSREHLTQTLLEIVSERTGYPPEMLKLDVDIEASLGVDSIKRVEILGILQRNGLPDGRTIPADGMDELTAIKTLGGIVAWLIEKLGAEESAKPAQAAPAQQVAASANGTHDEVDRALMVAVDAPSVAGQRPELSSPHFFLLTDDGRGLAACLAGQLQALGARTTRVGLPGMELDGDVRAVDLGDPAAAAELVASLQRDHGPISGIIHLLPLRPLADLQTLDRAAWQERLRQDVKGLFYLAKAAAADLKQAGSNGRAWVLAATALGEAAGYEAVGSQVDFPGDGGLAGLVKTFAQEWPQVRCRTVNLDMTVPPAELTDLLLGELAAADHEAEVRYQQNRRRYVKVNARPHPATTGGVTLGPESVILVTGGARGITAEIALELGEHYQPTLVLLGSTPQPAEAEPAALAGLTAPRELKAALMEHLRQQGAEVTLARVEADYNRLIKAREMRANLARITQTGARVEYVHADVRDEQALANVVAQIYARHGRIDGVVHGAGVIEDKLVQDKTPESFDRVFDTKADSAWTLSRCLRPEGLQFLAFFTSAAGVFGNRGQADYAATNEVLNHLAAYLDHRWPGRVFAINWGPWQKSGMVSAELEKGFAQRGINLVTVPAGRAFFIRELESGRKGETSIVAAGGNWGAAATNGDVSHHTNGAGPERNGHVGAISGLPLLQYMTVQARNNGHFEIVRTLDPARDLYLNDHRLDGKPVVPVAMAMELMAEVAQQLHPELVMRSVHNLRVLRGIVLPDGPKPIRIIANAQDQRRLADGGVEIQIEIVDEQDRQRPYYRTGIGLLPPDAKLPVMPPPTGNGYQPFPLSVEQAYREWLFHGPIFQGVQRIHGIDQTGIAATLVASPPGVCLAGVETGQWLIDPVVFDSGLQLILLWARNFFDVTPLPSGCRRYLRFGSLTAPQVECLVQTSITPDGHTVHGNLFFLGADKQVLGVLEDLECTASRALNRLAGGHLRG